MLTLSTSGEGANSPLLRLHLSTHQSLLHCTLSPAIHFNGSKEPLILGLPRSGTVPMCLWSEEPETMEHLLYEYSPSPSPQEHTKRGDLISTRSDTWCHLKTRSTQGSKKTRKLQLTVAFALCCKQNVCLTWVAGHPHFWQCTFLPSAYHTSWFMTKHNLPLF